MIEYTLTDVHDKLSSCGSISVKKASHVLKVAISDAKKAKSLVAELEASLEDCKQALARMANAVEIRNIKRDGLIGILSTWDDNLPYVLQLTETEMDEIHSNRLERLTRT